MSSFQVLDCTIRDGGYMNNWWFDDRTVREVYRCTSQAGVDYVEIGFHGTEEFFEKGKFGPWRYSKEDRIREVIRNIDDGAKLALMVDFTKFHVHDIPDRKDSVISLIRMATHKDYIYNALKTSKALADKGYEVAVNAMGIAAYSKQELQELADELKNYADSITFFYLADSYGSIKPNDMKWLIAPFLKLGNQVMLGFHPHNNMQMALANTLEARRHGISIVDSTLFGMGRGAGNLPTESLLAVLESEKPDRYNVLPVTECCYNCILPLRDVYTWGYRLEYLYTGIMGCHPNYARHLIEHGGLKMQEVEGAVRIVSKLNPTKFDAALMDRVLSVTRQQNGGSGDYEPLASPSMNRNVVASYKAAHSRENRPFLVLGNGPTLAEYEDKIEAFIQKHDPIILAANLCNVVKPHYHAFVNVKRYDSYKHTVNPEATLLLSETIVKHDSSAPPHQLLIYDDYLKNRFNIDEPTGRINTNCCTVSVLLLAVSIVMGATKIYAVGMDGYISAGDDGKYFYYDEEEKEEERVLLEKHQWNAEHIGEIDTYMKRRGYSGISILTPTSYKSWFTSIHRFL